MEDGGLCEECHDKPGYIVHHKVTLTQENIMIPEITLSFEHLKHVCKDCHDQFEGHGIRKKKEVTCIFDERGQPVPVKSPNGDDIRIKG